MLKINGLPSAQVLIFQVFPNGSYFFVELIGEGLKMVGGEGLQIKKVLNSLLELPVISHFFLAENIL